MVTHSIFFKNNETESSKYLELQNNMVLLGIRQYQSGIYERALNFYAFHISIDGNKTLRES